MLLRPANRLPAPLPPMLLRPPIRLPASLPPMLRLLLPFLPCCCGRRIVSLLPFLPCCCGRRFVSLLSLLSPMRRRPSTPILPWAYASFSSAAFPVGLGSRHRSFTAAGLRAFLAVKLIRLLFALPRLDLLASCCPPPVPSKESMLWWPSLGPETPLDSSGFGDCQIFPLRLARTLGVDLTVAGVGCALLCPSPVPSKESMGINSLRASSSSSLSSASSFEARNVDITVAGVGCALLCPSPVPSKESMGINSLLLCSFSSSSESSPGSPLRLTLAKMSLLFCCLSFFGSE